MTVSALTKIRAIGSASVLALGAGMAAGFASPAMAQDAPDPLAAPPSPGAPAVPGNAEECVLVAGVVTCAPGVDADGFFDASGDPLELDVQDGAVVQNSIIITGEVTGAVDGAIITDGNFEDALLVGIGSEVTVNGFVQTTGNTADGVETEDGATVTNNGTIYTTGNNSDAAALAQDSTFNNAGLVVTEGNNSEGVLGFGDGVTVDNAVAGTIVTSGDTASAVSLQDGANVTNAGLVQTFGLGSAGVETGASGNVANSGNIDTSGDFSTGIQMGDDAVVANSGAITTSGETSSGVIAGTNSSVSNSGSISTTGDNFSDAIVVGEGSSVTNSGSVESAGVESFGIFGAGDGVTVTNTATGSVSTTGAGGFGIVTANGGTVVNDGSVSTTGDSAIGIDVLGTGNVTHNGSVETTGDSSRGISLGAGSTLNSNGTVTTAGEDAFGIFADAGSDVTLGADSAVATTGVNAHGISSRGTVTIANEGSILADQGRGIDAAGGTTLTNAETGSIVSAGDDAVQMRGDASSVTNNGTIDGQVAVRAFGGSQDVINFGTLTGQSGDAALLGGGDDEFQQWTGAIVNGNVDLGAASDTFILEGSASSVTGTVDGGIGNDTAIIAGTLDADNFIGFETYQIGSTLGGTLNDAVISGNRTVDGDVSVVGDVALDLGIDSLTTTGAITLENGSSVTIDTSIGNQLVGQTVTVLQEGTTFADNGATITINDNDLLIDYVPVIGSLAVEVTGVNPLTASTDANVLAFGAALDDAVTTGTLSQGNFDLLNGLGDVAALEAAVVDAMPSLSEGTAREIFEASSTASTALDRHLENGGGGVWGEVAYRGADQDATSLSAGGYESEQMIATAGGDIAIGEVAHVGALASYASIENDNLTAGVQSGTSDIESIKVGVYGGVEIAEHGFVNVEISYLTGQVDEQRVGALGQIDSSYDFDGYGYRAVIGYDLFGDSDYSLTPTLGINGVSLSFDDAVETGGFGFTVARDDADFMELRAGLELAGELSSGIGGFISGTYAYDIEDEPRVFQLASAELGNFAVTLPEREQQRFELAAGATINLSELTKVEVGYVGEFASGYDSHAARARIRVGF